MGHDEIVIRAGRLPFGGIGVMKPHPRRVVRRPLPREREHDRAAVHGIDFGHGIYAQKRRQKTSVAVTQHQHPARIA